MIIVTSYNKVTTEDDMSIVLTRAMKRLIAYAHELEIGKINEQRTSDTEHSNTSF